MMDPQVLAPFYIGVAGKMSIEGYVDGPIAPGDLTGPSRRIYDWTWAVLDWLIGGGPGAGVLDRSEGVFDPAGSAPASFDDGGDGPCWSGVGLEHTPVVVLSSLAPGVDTLVAEAALDYAEARARDVRVRAPLPYEKDRYEGATSFVIEGKPDRSSARQKRFRALCKRIRKQGTGSRAPIFEVPLDAGLVDAFDPAELTSRDDALRGRRYRRYRAASEYVATMSHLLLAVGDTLDGGESEGERLKLRKLETAGTQAAIEAKRHGASFGLLADAEAMGWADNGPVLYTPLSFFDDKRSFERGERPQARFLHPYDSAVGSPPEQPGFIHGLRRIGLLRPDKKKDLPTGDRGSLSDTAREWQQAGDDLFRRIADAQDRMNGRVVSMAAEVDLPQFLGISKEIADRPAVSEHLAGLTYVLGLRRRAADDSGSSAEARQSVLKRLAWAILVAAVALGAYEQWYPAIGDAHGLGPQVIKLFLLATTIAAVVYTGRTYWRYRKNGAEQRRFDHRAIAEGLRVQLYWSACGLGRSVSARYMQRQRDELSWIRYAIVATTGMATRWSGSFLKLDKPAQGALLRGAREKWIASQERYAAGKVIDSAGRAHLWHTWGWALSAAGLASVFGKVASEVAHTFHLHYEHHWPWFGGAGLLAGVFFLWHAFRHHGTHTTALHSADHDPSPQAGFIPWVLKRPVVWGWALVLAALVFMVSQILGSTSSLWPTAHSIWIVLAGGLFVGGALCLAWAERRGFADEARQYQALRSLHACASRRLGPLIKLYEDSKDADESRKILAEIHRILESVGIDALDENAEWLIRARSRPLEPFMAG